MLPVLLLYTEPFTRRYIYTWDKFLKVELLGQRAHALQFSERLTNCFLQVLPTLTPIYESTFSSLVLDNTTNIFTFVYLMCKKWHIKGFNSKFSSTINSICSGFLGVTISLLSSIYILPDC